MKLRTNILYTTARHFLNQLLLMVVLCLVVSSCAEDFESPELVTGPTIIEVVVASNDFDLLEAALAKTGLASAYATAESGTFTLFAPNDAAFLAFLQTTYAGFSPPADEQEALTKIALLTNGSAPLNLPTLIARLDYHIISSELTSAQITGSQTIATLNGARLSLSVAGGQILLNGNFSSGAMVLTADMDASNGVVHTIDKFMPVPSTTTTVLSNIGTGGLTISYTTATPTITGGSETGGNATGTDFNILAYAIRRAGLVPVLIPNKAPLPDFTLFASTDNAMRAYLGDVVVTATPALENAAIQKLKALDPAALADLLKYHIVSGRYLSTDLTNGKVLNSLLESKSLTVAVSSDVTPVISVQDANGAADPVVTIANFSNSNNGVVHTINGVLRSN